MRPPSDALENFRLLLVGPVGSGKSSFCNTVASVFRGRITQRAMVGEGAHSVTTAVRERCVAGFILLFDPAFHKTQKRRCRARITMWHINEKLLSIKDRSPYTVAAIL